MRSISSPVFRYYLRRNIAANTDAVWVLIEDQDSIFWTSPITMASSLFTSLVERVEKLVSALIRIMIRASRFIDWLKETNVAGNAAARSMFVLSGSSRCCGIRSFSRYKNGALSGAGNLRDESLRQ